VNPDTKLIIRDPFAHAVYIGMPRSQLDVDMFTRHMNAALRMPSVSRRPSSPLVIALTSRTSSHILRIAAAAAYAFCEGIPHPRHRSATAAGTIAYPFATCAGKLPPAKLRHVHQAPAFKEWEWPVWLLRPRPCAGNSNMARVSVAGLAAVHSIKFRIPQPASLSVSPSILGASCSAALVLARGCLLRGMLFVSAV
jgi:hypothetical protein